MKQRKDRPWLALAVRAQRHQTHDLSRTLADARETAASAQATLRDSSTEVGLIEHAWRQHRATPAMLGALDEAFQDFHAHADQQREQDAQHHAACEAAAELALQRVQASYARLCALDTMADRLRQQAERDALRREYIAQNEIWGLRSPTGAAT
jgi:flagellar biosynthesis chaperone FliJ